eukprot:TRINITY_DN16995_c0_g1_i1.p1 TRINITY_DN16995_c0_g1~~TRINITY_DN16995_c0_g1_i1.p1  ORF type:complete len:173 (-),score=19.11 TRINITY_DN16995_c0_g1_i1:92-559(-)
MLFYKKKGLQLGQQMLVGSMRTFSVLVGQKLVREAIYCKEDIDKFVGMTGDSNPIHACQKYARQNGFEDVVVPGLLMASLFPAIIGSNFPGAVYVTQSLKFREVVLVNQKVVAEVVIKKKSGSRIQLNTECIFVGDDNERRVVVDGEAVAIFQQH